MDPDTTESLTLPDGRKLAYTQFGAPTGKPVIFLHGHPGSRFDGAQLHDVGLKLGAKIICPERPGFGISSPQPGRKLLDTPKDIECLTDHLKLEKYGVIGVSGGGPYALACAYALPRDKCKALTIVCGLGPTYKIGMKGAGWLHWFGFNWGYQWANSTTSRFFWRTQTMGRTDLSDEERFRRHMKEFSGPPRSVSQEKDNACMGNEVNARRNLRSSRAAFAQGYDGALHDGQVLTAPFGFRLEDIRPGLKLQLWYGRQDFFVPLSHGEHIAKVLGDQAELHVKDETHASIFFDWRDQFMADLVKSI